MRIRGVPRCGHYLIEATLVLFILLLLLHQNTWAPTVTEQKKISLGRSLLDRRAVPNPDTLASIDGAADANDDDVDDAASGPWSPRQQLLENLVPPNVYYWWCGQRSFEFKHYLSVRSAIHMFNPDKIVFHYEHLPSVDRNHYHAWFDELKRDVQFFEPRPMTDSVRRSVCGGKRVDKLAAILTKLNQNGGVYVSENTWLIDVPPRSRLVDLDLSVGDAASDAVDGYAMMRAGRMQSGVTLGQVKRNATLRVRQGSCGGMRHVFSGVAGRCVVVKGGEYERIFPLEVIYRDDEYGKLVRRLFYGRESIPQPVPSYDTLVPNIGHMIWIGGKPISYVFYLSVLSMLYIVKVDVLYIHCDVEPRGEHWQQLDSLTRVRSRIKLITRTSPTSVFQGPIESHYKALMSDIIRVDLMIKYGGVYTDTDAIWTKPLSREERGYGAVATYDWVDWTRPYPNVVNFGVSYGKRNAPFWRLFRESMRELHNDLHGYTGVSMPYKLLEKQPQLLRIDKRLGVICYYSKCHPLWVPDYHNASNNHLTTNSIKNWREDVHAFHWTFPDPDELTNQTSLMRSQGMFAEIGKYVLQQAGML